jgi:SAM-dependent methyltransferase
MRNFSKYKKTRAAPSLPRGQAAKTGWEQVSDWYGGHMSESDSLLNTVVNPGVLKLLAPEKGKQYLDIACGEGAFTRLLVKNGVHAFGFDASPSLIERAERLAPTNAKYAVGDATRFAKLCHGLKFDGATCLLAIQNIDPIIPVFHDAASVLALGAPFVMVMNHPSFRIPRQSAWGWEEARQIQYRRVDMYMSPMKIPILAHPGADPSIKTVSYHRPLSTYINALGEAGFAVSALEEWTSNRVSDSGPKAKAENRARSEFPMFLALRAIKVK